MPPLSERDELAAITDEEHIQSLDFCFGRQRRKKNQERDLWTALSEGFPLQMGPLKDV